MFKMASDSKQIYVKWSGKEILISDLSDSESILDLKNKIEKETGVHPVAKNC